jgi:uncharacterized protein YbaP (TraB family)
MKISLAHILVQGQSVAVFAADAPSRLRGDRAELLQQLILKARMARLKVDKAALAFVEAGCTHFFGADDLVDYLANRGFPPNWTHTIDF